MIRAEFDRKYFFDKVRKTPFGGTLTQLQVDHMQIVMDELEKDQEVMRHPWWIASVFATILLEVGTRMQPVREGFAATNQGAINAVTDLYRRGKISVNYALPDPVTGLSYYGRGFVQTTHKANYLKSGTILGLGDLFVRQPDLLLRADYSARTMIAMMKAGGYRAGKSFMSTLGTGTPTRTQLFNAREMINGDKNYKRGAHKVGDIFADYVAQFRAAIRIEEFVESPEPVVEPPVPAPELEPAPDFNYNPPEAPATQPSFWASIIAFFRSLFKGV